jgi:hypothetical protein
MLKCLAGPRRLNSRELSWSFRRHLLEGCSRIRVWCERLNGRLMSDSETRGLKLLREWLSPDQLVQFESLRYFDVIGSDTGKTYRIHYNSPMNIDELDGKGRARVRYCFVTDLPVAQGDLVLAQKIALETKELKTLAIANKSVPERRLLISDFPFC